MAVIRKPRTRKQPPQPWPPPQLALPDTIEAIEAGRPQPVPRPSILEAIRERRRSIRESLPKENISGGLDKALSYG